MDLSPQILSNVLNQARGSLRGSALMVSWRSVRRGRKPQLAQPIRNRNIRSNSPHQVSIGMF